MCSIAVICYNFYYFLRIGGEKEYKYVKEYDYLELYDNMLAPKNQRWYMQQIQYFASYQTTKNTNK